MIPFLEGALDKARGALRGVLPGLFRPDPLRAPDWAADRPRILLLGPTGAGKSALVNAVLSREDAAASGAGAPVTQGTVWHAGEAAGLALALGDTRGLEAAESGAQVAALQAALAGAGEARRPDLAWLVINAEGARAFAGEGTLAALAGTLRGAGLPFLVVLTHAEPGEGAHAGLRARIGAVMGGAPVLAVNTRPLRGEDGAVLLPAHGLEALLAESRRALEAAPKATPNAAPKAAPGR